MATRHEHIDSAKNNNEGLAGLLSAILTQTSIIQTADDAVDGKAHNLMAAALVVVALLGTQLRGPEGQWYWWTLAAMVTMIIDVCFIVYLTRVQKHAGAVVDLHTHPDYFTKDNELLLAQLVEDASLANDSNTQILERKASFFRLAVGMFLVGFVLGIVALVVIEL
jgi:hypothetical protein